jgi:hypothetical protein
LTDWQKLRVSQQATASLLWWSHYHIWANFKPTEDLNRSLLAVYGNVHTYHASVDYVDVLGEVRIKKFACESYAQPKIIYLKTILLENS